MKRYAKALVALSAVIVVFVLAACNSGTSAKVYRIITVDENGAPIKGVGVQLCSNVACHAGTTDDQGIAVFEGLEEGTYTAHVNKVPEGYVKDTTEYDAPSTYGDVTITLKKE